MFFQRERPHIRLLAFPALACLGFLIIVLIGSVLGSRNEEILVAIEQRYYPAVARSTALDKTMTAIQRGFQDAVAANNISALAKVDGLFAEFMRLLDDRSVTPSAARERLKREITSYYSVARPASESMIRSGVTQPTLDQLRIMNSQYGSIRRELHSLAENDRRQIVTSFASARTMVRAAKVVLTGSALGFFLLTAMGAVRVWRGEAQRTMAVRSLAASERRLRSISQSALDAIVSADISGRIVFWNSSAAKMFGHSDLEMAGLSVSQILTLSAEGMEASVPALAGRVSTVIEANGLTSNGGELPLEVSVTQWSTDDETFLTLILRDISERRQAETVQDFLRGRLEQANRVNGLGRVAATVAHEFNNVLMGIQPFVDILKRPPLRERYIDLAVETIEGAIRRGKKVTEEILRFTQSGDAVLRPLDARRWLQSFIPEAEATLGANHRLEVVLPEEETFLLADPQLLQQIVANIVVNARDAMPDGGTVTVTLTSRVRDNDLPLSAVQGSDRYVHLSISDKGEGMPPDVLERIFEPLYTTKRSGTGLGLSVSRQLVLRQQGEILVDSTPGAGTTFHILLQRTNERPEKEEPKQPVARSVSSVVLVEDDPAVGEGLCAALETVGTTVRWVDRGAAAVAAVEQTAPDAVILDIDLPDVDGVEVYRQIAARWPSLPVVFSTGHSTDISKLPVAARTDVALLVKPYGIEELLTLLDSLLAPGGEAKNATSAANQSASGF